MKQVFLNIFSPNKTSFKYKLCKKVFPKIFSTVQYTFNPINFVLTILSTVHSSNFEDS